MPPAGRVLSVKDLEARASKHDATIAVLGLGTIGLASACLWAARGFRVLGFDISPERRTSLRKGQVLFEYADDLRRLLKEKALVLTETAEEAIGKADMSVVCVPTPIDADKKADLRAIRSVTEDLVHHLPEGGLVSFESTLPLGTARQVGESLAQRTGRTPGVGFGLVVCPHRYMQPDPKTKNSILAPPPGEFGIINTPRVLGGMDEVSLRGAAALYGAVLSAPPRLMTSLEAAEAVKVLENSFRMVNIAFSNEVGKALLPWGLNPFEVISAAATKPFAFLAHYPGPGVGGECIPVVSWFLVDAGRQKGVDLPLTLMASQVNASMSSFTVDLLRSGLEEAHRPLRGARVAVLGLAFRRHTNDVRLSPTFPILDALRAAGATTSVVDPYVQGGSVPLLSLETALRGADALLLVTDHDDFRKLDLAMAARLLKAPGVVVDTRGTWKSETVRAAGLIYRGWDRGSGRP